MKKANVRMKMSERLQFCAAVAFYEIRNSAQGSFLVSVIIQQKPSGILPAPCVVSLILEY